MPVLTAAGCNTGSCHGSARGQDGFHLSLYGFDPKGDYFRLILEMAGRRVNLALPEDSLLITKAIGAVPHTGGKVFKPDSSFYETLVQWIRDGAKYDEGEIPQPTGIEIRPGELVLTGKDVRVPFTVRASYSDGSDRDVTTLTAFSSSNDNSVVMDRTTGMATSAERGEAFLLGRKEFTEMWVMKWAELMQIRTIKNDPNSVSYKAALNYYEWLRERIASNMPVQ